MVDDLLELGASSAATSIDCFATGRPQSALSCIGLSRAFVYYLGGGGSRLNPGPEFLVLATSDGKVTGARGVGLEIAFLPARATSQLA